MSNIQSWQEIQRQHPNRWVILQVITSITHEHSIQLTKVLIIQLITNDQLAYRTYHYIRKQRPDQHIAIAHTKQRELFFEQRLLVTRFEKQNRTQND